jgi:23S rRNA (guanine745-N1)-methyltransferase
MLDDVIPYLACPHCGGALERDGGSLRCGTGHAFDIARQGYVSLQAAGGTPGRPDTAAMVQARADFLAAGYFGSLAATVATTLAAALDAGRASTPASTPGCVADVGAGTGYYLAAVLDRLPGRVGLALDASKFALRKAARAHPRVGAAGCDVWRHLPVADGAAAAALSVFAPRNGAELHRILHRDGWLLVVTPRPEHLGELIEPLGLLTVDPGKQARLAGKLGAYFELASQHEHVAELSLGHAALHAVVAMGPSSWHVDPEALAARISRLPDPVPVTLAVALAVFRVRPPAATSPEAAAGDRSVTAGQLIDLTTASSRPANEAR